MKLKLGLNLKGIFKRVLGGEILNGLIQWLTGSYSTTPPEPDGEVLDQTKQKGGYPDISSGYGLEFDGVNDLVSLWFNTIAPTAFQNLSDKISFAALIKTGSSVLGGGVSFVSQYSINDFRGATSDYTSPYSIGVSDGKITVGFFDGVTTERFASTGTLSVNSIYHVAFTIDGLTCKIYIDGSLDSTHTLTVGGDRSVGGVSNSHFTIGSRVTNTNAYTSYWNGDIYTTQIFSTALTENQILELYNGALRPSGITDADVALDLRLIEGAGALAKDYSGNGNDGTISGATWIDKIPYGQQMAFAGHNITLVGGGYINVAGKKDDSTQDIDGNAITDFVYDANRYKLPTEAVQIFDGVDDDVSLSSEITYAADFELKFVLAPNTFTNGELVTGSTGEYIRLNSATEIGLNTSAGVSTFTVSLYQNAINQITIRRIGTVVLAIVNGQIQASATNAGTFKINNIGSDTFDGYLKSVEDVGNHKWTEANGWIDEIGSNGGTLNGSPESKNIAIEYANHATPKTGIGLEFDGVNDFVSVPSVTADQVSSGTFTYEVWFKYDGTIASGFGAIFDLGGFVSGFVVTLTNTGRFRINLSSGVGQDFGSLLDDNEWHHAVFVLDDFQATVYIDGQQDGTFDYSGRAITSIKALYIGDLVNNEVDRWYNGFLAKTSLYLAALTEPQILELYQNPQLDCPTGLDRSNLALSLKLDDANGNLALDYSDNGNNGVIDGATWLHGQQFPTRQLALTNFNLYDYFNGVDSYVSIPITGLNTTISKMEFDLLIDPSKTVGVFVQGRDLFGTGDDFLLTWNESQTLSSIALQGGDLYIDNVLSTSLNRSQIYNELKKGIRRIRIENADLSGFANFFIAGYGVGAEMKAIVSNLTIDVDGTGDDHLWLGYGDEPWKDQIGSKDGTPIDINKSIIGGNTDNATTDLFGNPLTQRKDNQLNLPYIYHDGLITPHRDSMNPTDGVTIAFATEYALEVGVINTIMNKGNDATLGTTYGVASNASGFIAGYGVNTQGLTNAQFLTGVHHHVVIIRLNGDLKWYVDGILEVEANLGADLPTNNRELVLGNDGVVADSQYTKPIYDPRYYNRALSASEVDIIYKNYLKQ